MKNTTFFRRTTSKVKTAIFNILSNKIHNACFLELYAGTGAIGIEALKKGASKVVFVEKNPLNCKFIKKAIKSYKLDNKCSVIKEDVFKFIHKRNIDKFDIVFMDPPYQSDEVMKILPYLKWILCKDAFVLVEHYFKKTLPERIDDLIVKKRYKYGDTSLTLYYRKSK